MLIQIVITTHCNYECFYCAGRDMPQEHMSWERFLEILDRVPPGQHRINLQGEGEPTTHPRFWDMAAEVAARGHEPYTITNGSSADLDKFAALFPELGVSLDTVDLDEAERIGRHKIERMLRNLNGLLSLMGPWRVTVHTVDYGQPLQAVRAYLRERGIRRHVVQALQTKADYARRYPKRILMKVYRTTFRCSYIERPVMRYYGISGVEMPCCYIKDISTFTSIGDIQESLAAKKVPMSCSGCRQIMRPAITAAKPAAPAAAVV